MTPRFRSLAEGWLAPLALLLLNISIAARLFRLEYSANLWSNEGEFIAIARGVALHLGDLKWWPEWACGLPFQSTYLPLLHVLAGLLSRVSGHSPALAFHQTGAAFLCVGPVFVYFMARGVTRLPGASFFAAVGSTPNCRRQVKSWLVLRSCRRATSAIEAPSSRLSSTIRRFSSRDHDRRRRLSAAGSASLPDISDSVRL